MGLVHPQGEASYKDMNTKRVIIGSVLQIGYHTSILTFMYGETEAQG